MKICLLRMLYANRMKTLKFYGGIKVLKQDHTKLQQRFASLSKLSDINQLLVHHKQLVNQNQKYIVILSCGQDSSYGMKKSKQKHHTEETTLHHLRHDHEQVETPYRSPRYLYYEIDNKSSSDHTKYGLVDYYEKEREGFASTRYYG